MCHSEECSDEESVFDLLSWSKDLKKVQSRCFISFSMTQQQTANAPKDSAFLGVLCVFAREIQLSVAA
jgi:hypothetical protein